VNLLSGDGQGILLPSSFLVASSSFLQSLLPTPCACPTSPTISLPSTTGLTLQMLAQIFSNGETEQLELTGETTETCVKSVQEVLELLGSEVKVVLDFNCFKSLKVVKVTSLAHETVVVKEEFESCDNWDGSLAVHEKVDSDSPQDCRQERKEFSSSSTDDFEPTSLIENIVSSFKDPNVEAASQTSDKNIGLKCPFCARYFQKLKSLITHKMKRHGEQGTGKRKYSCQKCDLNYSCAKSLRRHVRVKHENRRKAKVCMSGRGEFQCSECDLWVFSAKDLVKHRIDIHGENDESEDNLVQCPECGLHFSNRSHLNCHITKKHKVVGIQEESEDFAVNQMRVSCSECKLTFAEKNTLDRHIKRVHEGVVYACGVCHKIAAQKSSIYVHCKAFCHDKDFIYEIQGQSKNVTDMAQCPKCGIRLRNNYLLIQHVAEKHIFDEEGNKLRFTCSQCKETFCDKITLKRHSERVHEGVTYACGVCDKFVSYKSKILAHCKESGHDQGLIYKIIGSSIEGKEGE